MSFDDSLTPRVPESHQELSARRTPRFTHQKPQCLMLSWLLAAALKFVPGAAAVEPGAQVFSRTATFESGATSLALAEGTVTTSASRNYTIYFTTPDGLNRFPLAQDIGGNPFFSRELQYFPGYLAPFVTDYVIFSSSGTVEYGTLRLNLQLADTSQDGIPDLLQRRFSGSGAFNGQASPDSPAGAAYSVGGVMTREPGQQRGVYSLTMNGSAAGRVVFTGGFSLVSVQGAMRYQRDGASGRSKLELMLTRSDGTMSGFSGVTDFSVRTINQVAVNSITLINAVGQTIRGGAMVLNRLGNRYVGSMLLNDGDLVTSWADFVTHFVEITDSNDSNNDGVPDLSSPYEPPPIITEQPKSQSVAVGSRVTLSAAVTSPSPVVVQWRFNGVPLPGANALSIVLENVQLSHSGVYTAVFTNRGGSVASVDAVLAVLIPPSIATHPKDQTVDVKTPVRFEGAASGSSPIRYQWRFNGVDLLSATNGFLSFDAATEQMAGRYDLVAFNDAGRATTSVARLIVNAPPSITSSPQPLAVGIGGAAVFRVTSSGVGPLTYQWQHFGTNIPSSNTPELRLSRVSTSMAGPYQVRVSNRLGVAVSAPANLTVLNRFIAGAALPDRQFKLRITGETGVKYEIQSSADLIRWKTLAAFPAFGAPPLSVEYTDSTASASPAKFYRAVPIP